MIPTVQLLPGMEDSGSYQKGTLPKRSNFETFIMCYNTTGIRELQVSRVSVRQGWTCLLARHVLKEEFH